MERLRRLISILLLSVMTMAAIVQFHHHDSHGCLHADVGELFEADPCGHSSDSDSDHGDKRMCSIRLDASVTVHTDNLLSFQPFVTDLTFCMVGIDEPIAVKLESLSGKRESILPPLPGFHTPRGLRAPPYNISFSI